MNKGFELREIFEKGEGVFATRPFHHNEKVMVGVIEKVLGSNYSHASQIGEHDYVLHAGLVSKVNHSCDPNCGIKVNKTGAHDFVAIKHISINEELTFDYAMRNYSVDHFPKKCMCGAKKCRGEITGWRDLSDKKKREYDGVAAPYLIAMDAKNI
ncbi:MAG: SET domain-containing protein-lysine N-methyltransferase [Candidatus Electrothrix aestuarii]|uniref:SET domain-containing protein-lysine N-methyltransferase n=1 Tax=Candidatus Electrothrix aestuarii TaxID=3062594 RepID=A0AAU8LR32_9BACT|nr:SET domain-containing protein-lysine N-methyltransferase [Candidatus Electrothrix aestuarii]